MVGGGHWSVHRCSSQVQNTGGLSLVNTDIHTDILLVQERLSGSGGGGQANHHDQQPYSVAFEP